MEAGTMIKLNDGRVGTVVGEVMEECECCTDWFCDECHNGAMEDAYGSHGQG